jgi:hypothetical protein
MTDGHSGLSNEKRGDVNNGDFRSVLSYLIISKDQACFVIHIYSNSFDLGPYLQRSDAGRSRNIRPDFLTRLGFIKCDHCNVLSGGNCYYKELQVISRGRILEDGLGAHLEVSAIHDRYKRFMGNIQQIYDGMHSVDRLLFDSGFEIPWDNMQLTPVPADLTEKVYPPGFQYDLYKDIKEVIDQAKSEIFIQESYPSEELINLYLDKVHPEVKIRLLIGTPKGGNVGERANFLAVAKKYSSRPGIHFEVRESQQVHDRLFFIDNDGWVIGSSIKDAAVRKPTYLLRLESSEILRMPFEDIWSKATKVI